MKSIIVIPARMQSTRLPGKPLIEILGKSLIQRTYDQCLKVFPKERIYVATDHKQIQSHCQKRDMQVVMTSRSCLTGTDRVAEVSKMIDADYYINVQGDEPLMNPKDIEALQSAIDKYKGEIINGYAPLNDEESYRNLTIPKLVFRPDGRLLYMSRQPIPGNKSGRFEQSWRQVCIYAYPKSALRDFMAYGKKTPLELMEDLEILRFLELDYEIRMIPLSNESIAVDVPEDIQKVIKKIKEYD